MTEIAQFSVSELNLDDLKDREGQLVILVDEAGKSDPAGRRLNKLSKGALARFFETDDFEEMKMGDVREIAYPTGMNATSILVAKITSRPSTTQARDLGGAIGGKAKSGQMSVFTGNTKHAGLIAEGIALRWYAYTDQKSDPKERTLSVDLVTNKVENVSDAMAEHIAIANGVFFTRDLVSAPANVLTTTEFANQLVDLGNLGVKVTVLEEDELERLGMRTLLSVGQGSESPSKVVVMEWQGGGEEQPFALVGKGVVFDTGGISLKPAGGMEEMTMDMGGAGVVSGVMKTLAMRNAKANVVGLVGLVENMPDGKATRPGDVVKSMKGDTVEIINTDAEGRLVLADVLWYAQEKYEPVAVINLATLTGAIIIGLGHEMAGVFSNSDELSNKFLNAANAEGEGAWRMPLAPAYDKQIDSQIADMQNVGGRAAGSITAGQFLQRFIKEDMPWIHLDIAGVASLKTATKLSPKGATGWGVRALNRLISDNFEA